MTLKVYNTLSRQLEEFKTVKKNHVGVYVCGLTVYDYMHIGHARTYIAFDVILRYLKYRGYKIKYVQNITDIDDKIIKRAKERGLSPLSLAQEYAEKSAEDQRRLGLLPADEYPKVSENIPDIINAILTLAGKGHAYVVDGDVYFDVSTFQDYGKLSNQDTEQLKKHRIEPDQRKKTPLDFSLWKRSDEGEIGFESPWGHGRPGWHIECSVMSRKYLGGQFDIHGGALDLVFPHHENEVAQSESLTGRKPFVKYWLHTGFLYSSGDKMSKSLGNIIPVREFLKSHSPDVLRLFVLQTHYRSQVDYGEKNILNAENALKRLGNFRRELDAALGDPKDGENGRARRFSEEVKKKFIECMDEDFNTPKALAVIFQAVKEINPLLNEKRESKESIRQTIGIFDELIGVLGLEITPEGQDFSEEEKSLVEERNKCRVEKKWGQADRIRELLLKRGITLMDKSDGTTIAKRVL